MRYEREQELADKLLAERPHDPDLQAIAQALRGGAPLVSPDSQFVRLPGGGRVPLQKPLRAQHFTGRELELARLLADLQPGKQMTLAGPGGIGKTALAAEAVWRLAPGDDPPDRFPDGVIFHTFYHQPQADAALEAIARAYGVEPRPTPRDAARLALANRKALLILDGAEAADDLNAVLQVAGSCGVLITTRHRGDAPDEIQDLDPLPRTESLDMLRAWAGTYAANDTAANDTVRLLGGLPLALFLVGRYLAQRKQTADMYAAWLREQGLAALNFGDRPSKSIPLLLQRSLEQVSQGAHAAFGVAGVLALAPFVAEAVAAALQVSEGEAHRALAELVDYGLLLRPDDDYQVTHALAHSYAYIQSVPSPEVAERLALYFVTLAKNESKKGPIGFAALDKQRSHIIAVQAAALKAEKSNVVQQIAWATLDYLYLKGYWADCVVVSHAGAEAARKVGDSVKEDEFLVQLGNGYADTGETRRAIGLYEQALERVRARGDRRGEGIILDGLGSAYYNLGDTRNALTLYEQQLAIEREINDRPREGYALRNLGMVFLSIGKTLRAIELYEEALKIARETGNRRKEGSDLGHLGSAYAYLGDTHRSIELNEEALRIARETGHRRGEGRVLGNLGDAYADMGETRRAIELYEQQLAIAREIGHRRGESRALGSLGNAYSDLGETRQALELYEQALLVNRQTGDRAREWWTLDHMGVAYINLGDMRRAIELYEKALAVAQETGDQLGETHVMGNLGDAYAKLGEIRRAIEQYEQKLAIAREIGHRRKEGRTLRKLGDAYAGLGDSRSAVELYEQALVIAREIGDRRGEAMASWNLGLAYEKEGDLARAVANMEICVAYEQEMGHPDAAADAQQVADLKQRAGL